MKLNIALLRLLLVNLVLLIVLASETKTHGYFPAQAPNCLASSPLRNTTRLQMAETATE